MNEEPFLVRLLHRAPQLFALTSPSDIIAHACREIRELAGVPRALGSYVVPPRPWERGVHLAVGDEERRLEGAAVSAMFAIHRRVAAARKPVQLEAPTHDAILAGLRNAAGRVGDEPIRAACAVPILQRTGRLVGEIVLAGHERELRGDVLAALDHIAVLTAAALDNAQRLAAARRAQDRLLLFAEATEDALWDWSFESDELWWGAGIHKLLGSGAERIGAHITWREERIHPEDAERVHRSFATCMRSGESCWAGAYRFRRTDGSWAHVEDRAYFLRDASGRAYRAIGAMRDVSELRVTHEALRDNEERLRTALADANVASRAKDEFLAMLGHELRNPLSPMLVALRLMRSRGAASRELDVLERQVGHLTRLVDDLLDVSRITRGKIALRRVPTDLADVVARAVEMAGPLFDQKAQDLRVTVPRGTMVNVDPARMAQVVSNLLTNAAKYSDAGSTVKIVVEKRDQRARIRVIDQGVGIEPDMIDHVFRLFVQQPQTIDRSQGGLGLGLAIVKSLVEMHGGTVHVRSDGRGLGSEFTVELPLEEAGAGVDDAPVRSTGARDRVSAQRVLVVDDNQDGAEMLKELLQHMGHQVEVAHDGPTALEIADRFDPSVALLDIGLPVMDGYELAGALAERRAGRSLRMVAITGYGQAEDRRRTANAGFEAHLVKPINLDQLEAVLAGAATAQLALDS